MKYLSNTLTTLKRHNWLISLCFIVVGTLFLKISLLQYGNSTEKKLTEMLSYDLARGDLLQIGNKISSQLFFLNWNCIEGKQENKLFFQRKSNICNESFFVKKITIQKDERPDILIQIYLKLPLDQQLYIFITFTFLFILTLIFITTIKRSHIALLALEVEKSNLAKEISYKIAHDIQSPLQILKYLSDQNFSNRELALKAIERINDISQGLLLDRKQNNLLSQNILHLINSIIIEKKTLFPNVDIKLIHSRETETAIVQPEELQAIISNLLNNSIEAEAKGIYIDVNTAINSLIIEIKDNGKGIPKNILNKLLNSQITQGKESGNGIGLYQAKKTILAWGGNIKIDSILNQGTIVTIQLKI